MKRKLSKLGRSTVSVLLCLVMLLTTFCFFDIGSVISEALISKSSHALTEAGTSSNTFAQYNISAPELVYIKPGGKDSEYFLNATSSGTVSEITSDTSALSFSCATARSVTVSITVLDANLNASGANRVTNVAFSDGTYMSSDKALSASSSSVTKTIKSISMANAEIGKEYVIRWNIVYTTASGSYTTYAYTGIKFPLLAQAGMTTRQYYYGTYGGVNGNPAESTTYSFITGVDAVKGGNVGSKWVSTGSTLTAPLINFNAGLYPRGLDMPINSNYFDPNGSGVLLTFAKHKPKGIYLGEGSRIYNTPWDSSQSYKPMDLITDDMVSKGYFGGKPGTDGDSYGYAAADIMIDTSRYTNFKQVPNLRAGFVEFDSDGGANQNYLNSIRNVSYTSSDAAKYFRKNKTINNNAGSMNTAPTIYCPDVDRSDEKNDRSWVRGLYKLDGNITTAKNNLKKTTSGGTELQIASFSNNVYSTYIRFEYSLRFNPLIGFDEYCSGISTVRLNATLTSKATARKYYSRFLNSGVNTSASNWSTIEGYVKSYVKTLCVSSAAAGSYTNPASAISTAQTNLKTVMKTTTPLSSPVYFYVPEAIYLAPRSSSWGAYTTSTFRYFVQNTINTSNRDASPTVKTGYDTTGYVYFSYANLSGDVTLKTRLWNSAMSSTLSGGSISSLSMSDDGQYKKATISSSSTSPSLSSTTTGYYIEWTASYKDAYDGHDKTITAYTYVYKPYVVPYGGSISAQNDRGNNTEAAQITWITGVHSINKEGDRYARYTTSNYQHGLLPFVSNSSEKINGGSYYGMNLNFSSYSEQNSQAVKKYSAFANTTSAQSYFFANQTNQTWNNWNPDAWYANKNATTSVSNSSTFDKATFSYSRHSNDNGSTGNRGRSTTQTAAAEGTLYIDTSRYTNLSQIPNLGVGIMVTRDDGSKSCAWYMADYTGRTNTLGENDRQLKGENPTRVIENWNDHGTIMVRYGTPYDRKTDGEGVKYNGTWVSNVSAKSSGDKKYAVRGTYYNYEDKDTIICSVMVNMNAKLIDKTDLRAVVRRAQNNFANFGVYNNSYSSRYYQNTGAYSSFISNYKAACAALTKVDGTYGTYKDQTKINALVTALGNNIDALVKEGNTVLKRSCPVNEYNLGLEKLSNGQYKIVEIKGGKQYSMTYDARDNVYFTPDTYEGYTYIGKCELTNVTIAPSDYYGKTLASLPTFFSASNLYSNSMSYSGSTVTIGTTTVKTTTVPQFDGDTTAYEWVAAVNDTSLTMVNFYFIDQNKIYFDPNDGSSGVNLLTQPTTYKSGNNFYSPTFTSSPGNGVTATFDQTDSTFTFNGTPTTGAEYFRFPIAGKLKANTNYTYRVVYVSGSKTLDGGTLTLTLDICDKNGNRCYKASGENYSDRFVFDQTANQATTSRTLAPDAYQAANAEFVQVFTYSPSYGTVRYNNYKVKIELVESGSENQTYSPNAIQQFYGRSIGTMPVPERANHRFLGWFTAPDGGDRVTASSLMGSTDRTVYAHWALIDKTVLLDNEFDFDEFVAKASTASTTLNNFADSYVARSRAIQTDAYKLSNQTPKPFTYSVAKDEVGDTSLNIKYDRSTSSGSPDGNVFDCFKSSTFTASTAGEYTLTYDYRINDYYSQAYEETGDNGNDSVVIGFANDNGYWVSGGAGTMYTENQKTSDGYESVELKRTFSANDSFFFTLIFYFCNEDVTNHFRADIDLKNIVIKDPNGNIVLSSNSMKTVNGSSSYDPDERTITLKPTAGDCYTDTYDSSQLMMKLDPGNYTFMFDYQATTNTRLLPYIFTFESETSNAYQTKSAGINVSAGSGTMAMRFTVKSDRPWIRVRFGVDNYNGGGTISGPVTFGNISVQRTEIYDDALLGYNSDSSTYLGWLSKVNGSVNINDGVAAYVNDLASRNEKITAHYQDLEYGSKFDGLYVPTREGYTFLGWYDANGTPYTDANGNSVDNHVCTTDGIKLYSRWTSKKFNLKYNAFRPNDSAGAVTAGTVGNLPTPNPQVLKFGVESSISLTAPTLTGYTFSGWSKTSGGTKAYDKGQALSASTVSQMYKDCNGGTYNIYTTWTANKYKIHFDKNATDANGSMADMDMVYDVAKNLNENKFSREGYTFQSWNTAENGSGTSYDDKALVNNLTATPNGTVTLYAQWTVNPYSIKVHSESNKYYNVTKYAEDTVGGTVQINTTPASTSTTLNYGTEYSITATAKTGYQFVAWYSDAALTKQVSDSATYSTTLGAANIEYYAKFNVRTYTITIDPNSPTTGSNISGWYDYGDHKSTPAPVQTITKSTSITMTYGSTVTMTAPKKTGYTFGGWKLDGNGTLNSTADITKNSTYTCGAGSGTVTAIWNINTFTIKYNGNGSNAGTSVPEQTFTYNVAQKLNKNTFERKYTITFNGNGGTVDNKTEVTDTAVWTSKKWNNKADGTGRYTYDDQKSVTNPCGLTEKGDSATLYAQWEGGNLNLKTAKRDGYVFLGWALTDNAEIPTYTVNQSVNFTKHTTFFAVWVETATAQERVKSIDVVSGITIKSNDLSVEPIVKTQKKYFFLNNADYTKACEAYEEALKNFNASKTIDNAKKLVEAVKAIGSYQAGDFKYDAPIKKFIREFEIEYASGVTGAVKSGTHKLSDLNLNHYTKEILSENADSILKQVKLAEAVTSISNQSTINEAVKNIAKNYATKTKLSTTPTYKVYENSAAIKKILSSSKGIEAVNYVRTDEDNAVYYCYANTTNPKIYLEVEDAMTSQNRLCYPTRSEVSAGVVDSVLEKTTSTVKANFTPGTKTVDNSTYTTYLNEGLGNTFKGTVNGKEFTGASYYKQKSTVELSPVFTENKNGAVEYVLTSTDDSYNSASTTLGGNYATTASLSAGLNSGKDFTGSTKKTVTIVIDYHSGAGINVEAKQVQMDRYLNQFHLLRASGGARNWELPQMGDTKYTVDHGKYTYTDSNGKAVSYSYEQCGYGSFTYTFTTTTGSGYSFDFNNCTAAIPNGNNPSSVDTKALTNEMVKKLAPAVNNDGSLNCAKLNEMSSHPFKGTRNNNKAGIGYLVWGTNWSYNYYPASNAFTYVHIVDRWGNVYDNVFWVGPLDYDPAQAKTSSTEGSYTILEDGGSGIETLSLNAEKMEILTDENSSLENNVYKTTGNTIRIRTGEAKKSYTLSMKDKATNASTATVTSDENGIITLSIEDTAYESGVYTFMLNGTQINLYSDKYILKVYDGEAEEGEYAELRVVTTAEVGKVRFTDTDGNTVTVSSSTVNEDGTKSWSMAKSRPAGEYKFSITVKIGHEWIKESSVGKLTFTERIYDSGLVRSAEYDAESGLYRITIEGRATKIQFVSEDGMTRTYTRYNDSVKSIKTYDEDGNEVNDTARTLDNEVWLVSARIYSGQKYTVAGKFEAGWNREGTVSLIAH